MEKQKLSNKTTSATEEQNNRRTEALNEGSVILKINLTGG